MAFGVGRELVVRRMSKSAVRVAREALVAGRAALPEYASPYSRKDYARPQLFALLGLLAYLGLEWHADRTVDETLAPFAKVVQLAPRPPTLTLTLP